MIGIVLAALATIYFCLLTYFDWMRYSHLPSWRQQLWSILHYPLHLSLIVFMQGFTQFAIWSKVTDMIQEIDFSSAFDDVDRMREATSEDIKDALTHSTKEFFQKYPMKNPQNYKALDEAIKNMTQIDDGFWAKVADASVDPMAPPPPTEDLEIFSDLLVTVQAIMFNSLFEILGVKLDQDMDDAQKKLANSASDDFHVEATLMLQQRYTLMVRWP